jgi:hypothetical protein
MDITILQIPLYKLYYVEDCTQPVVIEPQIGQLIRKDYDQPTIDNIIDSLVWATRNPDYDYRSLLPNIRHSNEQILQYFQNLLSQLLSLRSPTPSP